MAEKMNSKSDLLILALMAAMTVAYCSFVYLAINAFLLLVVQSYKISLPFVSRIAASPAHYWQILAIISFSANTAWALGKRNDDKTTSVFIRAAIIHYGWLFLCLLLHLIGMLLPFISRVYVIK